MTGKLTLLRCQTCGGEVKVLTADELRCLYCGNVYTLLGAGLVPPGQEQPMYLSEPVPEEGYYWMQPEWIVSGLEKLEWPSSRDIAELSGMRVTHPGIPAQELEKSIAARRWGRRAR